MLHRGWMGLRASGALGLLMIATVQAGAGGFAVHEQSAYGQGTSFAGIAAGGSLSAMFWNPAVMTQFAGVQSSSSYTGFFPHAQNDPTVGSKYLSLGGSGNIYNQALIPAGYFSYQLSKFSPNLWLGMSLNSPFGLSVGFPELWAGRDYSASATSLTTYNATPSVAYRFNDWISVGVGVQIQYAKASLNHGVTALVPFGNGLVPFNVGDVTLGGNGWGYGFTAGVTLTPTPSTMIGIGYRSGIDQKISGQIISPLGVFAADTTLDLPGIVSLGVRQRLDPQWTLLGTVEWTNWSRIGTANVTVTGAPNSVAPFQYRDGWFFALGAEYQVNDRMALRTGFAYEISPVTDQVRTPLIPDNDRFWASIGASWQIIRGLRADLAYSHVFVRDATVNISAASGNPWFATSISAANPTGVAYVGNATSHADIFSIGLNWRWDEVMGPAPSKAVIAK